MEMIRQYAVVHDGVVQVTVPEEFNEQPVEVQVILTVRTPTDNVGTKQKAGLGHLVGSLNHLTQEQKEAMNRELQEIRNSWERDIL